MIEDYIIDALVQIGNHKKLIEYCEPNIMESFQLETWMVKRTLAALDLLEKEYLLLGDK